MTLAIYPCLLACAALLLPWGGEALVMDWPTWFLVLLRIEHWPSLIAACLIEATAFAVALRWPVARAALAALALNAASFALGFLLYPLAGLILMAPVSALASLADLVGLGDVALFGLMGVGYALTDTLVEWPLCRVLFRPASPRRAFRVLALANLASGLTLVGIVWYTDTPARIPVSDIARLETHYAPEIDWMRDRMADMYPAGPVPWSDPAWLDQVTAEANEQRFLWLELRRTAGERVTLVPMAHDTHGFDARREDKTRLVIRLAAEGGPIHRYILNGENEKGWMLQVVADFAAPPD